MTNNEVDQLIQQLSNKASAKRRSAAKKLRKLKAKEAGSALFVALKNELKDKRTWETQYQIIMALGELEYIETLNFLIQLVEQEFEATMVHTAIGDAITTIEFRNNQSITSLLKWIDFDRKHLAEGGFRSLAMNRIKPNDVLINTIIDYVSKPENEYLTFWVAAAAPSWPNSLTVEFLNNCLTNSDLEDTKKAAFAALNGKYLKWKPL